MIKCYLIYYTFEKSKAEGMAIIKAANEDFARETLKGKLPEALKIKNIIVQKLKDFSTDPNTAEVLYRTEIV